MEEKCKRFARGNDGFALLSVLVILAILTPLVVDFSYSARVQMSGAHYFANKAKSREIARAGMEAAILALKKDGNNYDSYSEEWGEFEELSQFSNTFFEEGSFAGKIEDEEGKLNINKLDRPDGPVWTIFTRLFETLGYNTDSLYFVSNWLDDDNVINDLIGAEDDYYNSLDNPYFSKDGDMDIINEMVLIKDVGSEMLYGDEESRGLIDFVTVYGDSKININTAPAEVIQSLDDYLDAATVGDIIAAREEEAFKDPKELEEVVSSDIYDSIKGKIKVISSHFSIKVRGYIKELYTDIHAIVNRNGNKVTILYYSEV